MATKANSDADAPKQQNDWLSAPGFITFTDVTPAGAEEPEFVICNEATGKYFLANRPTVQFFVAIKETGSVRHAQFKSGIPSEHGEQLVQRLVQSGLLVRSGETQSDAGKKPVPIESRLISMRWDMIDMSRPTRALSWLGRLLYSPLGYLAWVFALIAMAQALMANSEKLNIGLRQFYDASWAQALIFLSLFIAVKFVHEMGHALAYRTMCQQESLSPGPIRMGISIFAFTPFPFTDVTGAWRLKSSFRRVMIGAGGIYFETWLIALLTLFWANTQAGMFQTIILQVAVFAGLLALVFNLNPAIKLDGYYILTDYLRKPNLSGRASQAARSFVARLLGAKVPAPVRSDLAYWCLSYLYRWTIFGGIFWLIYQFDPRLAPLVFAVVAMTLIGRPLYNTLQFARSTGVRIWRVTAAIGGVVLLGVGLTMPFPDRILMQGQMRHFETQFVEPAEAGRLRRTEKGALTLFDPRIEQQIADLTYRREMMENLQRASFNSSSEQTRLAAEVSSLSQMQAELITRRDKLQIANDKDEIWTPIAAQEMQDAWVTPSEQTVLGAQSRPVAPFLLLRLDQALLERDLSLQDAELTVRAMHDPDCQFSAQLTDAQNIAKNDLLVLRAAVVEDPAGCSQSVKNGGGVVAKLTTKPRSILQRLRFGASRLLQDRLPI